MIDYLFEKPFVPIMLLVVLAVGFRIAWSKTESKKMRNVCYASFAVAVLVAVVAFFVTTPVERLGRQLDTMQEELLEGNFDVLPPMLADTVTVVDPDGRHIEGPRETVYADVQRVIRRNDITAVDIRFGEREVDRKNRRATVEILTLPLRTGMPAPAIQWLVTLEYADTEWKITRAKSLGAFVPGEGE
jgi:hypothetical protein